MSTFTQQQQDPFKGFSKCNLCHNPIIWNDALAQSKYGNRKPFVLDQSAQHVCPRDGQGNVIKVQGYVLQGKKVVWVGVDANGHTIGAAEAEAEGTAAVAAVTGTPQVQPHQAAEQQQQQQQPKQGTISQDMMSDVFGKQLGEILKAQQEMKAQLLDMNNRVLNMEQSQKYFEMLLNSYMKSFNRMMDTVMKFLPEPELRPITADRLLEEGKENNKQDQEEELNLEEQ